MAGRLLGQNACQDEINLEKYNPDAFSVCQRSEIFRFIKVKPPSLLSNPFVDVDK